MNGHVDEESEAAVSKLDELIDWHEKHAMYYTDSAVLQQAHRDTAEALRLCRDAVVKAKRVQEIEYRRDRDEMENAAAGMTFSIGVLADARQDLDAALDALRDAGMIGEA